MAKKEEEKNTEVALADQFAGTALSLGKDETEGVTDYGYSDRQEDSLVPILAILQDNSAEVKRQHSKYIEGAKSGDLIIRALGLVIDPEATPVAIQQCGFVRVWVEWDGEPGEGVPVGRYPYDDMPDGAREVKDEEGRTSWVLDNGNRLVDTREHYCQILINGSWMPIVVPMSGTNHTVSRAWTTDLKNIKTPSGQRCPAWFRAYRITTKYNERGSQSWFTYKPIDLGWIQDREVRDAGRLLNESLKTGAIAPDVAAEAGSATDDEAPI